MAYFNYHAALKKMIREGKLTGVSFKESYNGIREVMLLYFDDPKRPVAPVRKPRWAEYTELIRRIDKEK